MSQPIIGWYDEDNNLLTEWNMGEIEAGTLSQEKTFFIWNNKSGSIQVPDIIECNITTKDSSGNDNGAVVEGRWLEVKCDSLGDTDFTAIGKSVVHSVAAEGNSANYSVSGGANTGDHNIDSSKKNFIKLTARLNVPQDAANGIAEFLLRLNYKYI